MRSLQILIGGKSPLSHTVSKKSLMWIPNARIAAVPPFPALRRFPEGRGFKQWTGDDSKALMKVRHIALIFYPALLTDRCRVGLSTCH